MNKFNNEEAINNIQADFQCDMEEVGANKYDLFLENFFTTNEKEYEMIESILDNFSVENDAFDLYVSYDVSGFDYWINNVAETNYIMLVIDLKKELTINEQNELGSNIRDFQEKLNEYDGVRNAYSNEYETRVA